MSKLTKIHFNRKNERNPKFLERNIKNFSKIRCFWNINKLSLSVNLQISFHDLLIFMRCLFLQILENYKDWNKYSIIINSNRTIFRSLTMFKTKCDFSLDFNQLKNNASNIVKLIEVYKSQKRLLLWYITFKIKIRPVLTFFGFSSFFLGSFILQKKYSFN